MFRDFILAGVPQAVFWSLVGLAIVIQGISKSGFAGGAGILSLPLMMLVMPVEKVPAVLLPILILCDLNAIYHHRHNKRWDMVMAVYLPSILGVVLGALTWWWIGQEGIQPYGKYVKQFAGVLAFFFAFYIGIRETAMKWVSRYYPGRTAAWITGVSAGFCSTMAHAAGPIVGLYLYAQDMGKSLFVGTVAWTFTLLNLTKLPFYFAVGLIHVDVLLLDIVLIPFVPLGSALGKWMHHRVSESAFNRVILVLTLIAAIQLVFNVNLVELVVKLGTQS